MSDNHKTIINSAPVAPPPLLMDEIIDNPPGWLMHSGVSILMIVAVLGLTLSGIIKYPDKITAPFLITSENPPVDVVCKTSTQIDTILVQDRQVVRQGMLLAVMDSGVDWQNMQALCEWLDSIAGLPHAMAFRNLVLPEKLEVGDLQTGLTGLIQQIRELQYFLSEHLTQQRLAAMESEIHQTRALNRSLAKQQLIFQDELHLIEKDFLRTESLNSDKSVSDRELEIAKGKYLQQKRTLENMHSNIIQNEIRQEQLRTQQIEIKEKQRQELRIRYLTIRKVISELTAALSSWKETYWIQAPVSGTLSLAEQMSPKQFVANTQVLATIIPQSAKGRIIGKAYVPAYGIGRIDLQNQILFRLEAYPDKEYGVIEAKIDQIALLPQDNNEGKSYYLMEAVLPDTLITSYQQIIPFRQHMRGNATIITEDKSILERLFENILNMVKNA